MSFAVNIMIISALVTSFFNLPISWLLLGLATSAIYLKIFDIEKIKWDYIPELSYGANSLFQTFGYFFTERLLASALSSSASFIQFVAIVVAIVGAFKSFYWGILFAIFFQYACIVAAKKLNPTKFIRDPQMAAAYNEVVEYMNQRNNEAFKDALSRSSKP